MYPPSPYICIRLNILTFDQKWNPPLPFLKMLLFQIWVLSFRGLAPRSIRDGFGNPPGSGHLYYCRFPVEPLRTICPEPLLDFSFFFCVSDLCVSSQCRSLGVYSLMLVTYVFSAVWRCICVLYYYYCTVLLWLCSFKCIFLGNFWLITRVWNLGVGAFRWQSTWDNPSFRKEGQGMIHALLGWPFSPGLQERR